MKKLTKRKRMKLEAAGWKFSEVLVNSRIMVVAEPPEMYWEHEVRELTIPEGVKAASGFRQARRPKSKKVSGASR